LGNTSIYLGNTTTTIGNLTLTNVTISSGSANITSNITYATANAVVYTNSSNVGITSTSLIFNGTNLGVGNANPQALLHVGSVVEAPAFGTTSQMCYVNGTSQPEVLVRQTVNDVVVSMYADSTSGSIRTATNHPLVFFTNNTDRMRLDASGNLGLGVTPSVWSSGYKALQIGTNTSLAGNTGGSVAILSSNAYFDGSNYVRITADSSALYQMATGSHNWRIAGSSSAGSTVSFTQAMTLDASGNLLVGTTDTTKTNTGFRVESGVANTSRGSTGSFFEFYDTGSGSRIGYISNSGGVATLYNTTSDQRLKTNIVDAQSGNIDSIKVRSFDWIVNGSHQPYGMVAQELIEVAPYAVNKPENPDEMMAVDYSKLVPMMIKEIQDLKQRIVTLENK
jgi:hypothetical protein